MCMRNAHLVGFTFDNAIRFYDFVSFHVCTELFGVFGSMTVTESENEWNKYRKTEQPFVHIGTMYQVYNLFMKCFHFNIQHRHMISFHSIWTRVDGWSNKLCILYKRVDFSFSLFSFVSLHEISRSFIQCCRLQCTVFSSAFSIQSNHSGWYSETHVRLRCLIEKSNTNVWSLPDTDVTLEMLFSQLMNDGKA